MVLTSLAEPLCPLVKNNKLITELIKYLFQYRKVAIPSVGSLELGYEPAWLDVADKKMVAPAYVPRLVAGDTVADHQYRFLSASLNLDTQTAGARLVQFGRQLKEEVLRRPVVFNGLGVFRTAGQQIVFEPQPVSTSLTPVAAQKVIRQNASHQVLVGERERNSVELAESLQTTPVTKTSLVNLMGWIVLLLAVAAIVYLLYRGAFHPSAAGLN